jgi:L-lactate permease
MLQSLLASVGYALPPSQSVVPFLLLTVLLGGGAAWRAGQAVAGGWGEAWPVVVYTALIAQAVRFLHYALFGAKLVSLHSFLLDFAILVSLALLGHRIRRTRHMSEQYPWLFERAGVVSWRRRT